MADGRLPVRWETERLVLRSYNEEDASWYYPMSLRNRAHLRRYESGNVIMSLTSEQNTRESLGELAKYWEQGICYFVGAFDKTSGEFVAQIYVGPFSVTPVDFIIGYMAECQHEGRGYVSEAVASTVGHIFAELGTDQVRIHCNETNVRSRRVAERCGFQLERVFPEERAGPDGHTKLCNTVVYLRLRSSGASS
jgi:RimJ/RimL family protein N-acetyltransferase